MVIVIVIIRISNNSNRRIIMEKVASVLFPFETVKLRFEMSQLSANDVTNLAQKFTFIQTNQRIKMIEMR